MPQGHLHTGPIPETQLAHTLQGHLQGASVGSQAVYVGRVRADETDGHMVQGIEFSAYPELIEAELLKLEEDYLERYPSLQQITIIHATGYVACGEIALLVVLTGGLYKVLCDALAKMVTDIRTRLPIWRKEFLDDGKSIWTEID